MTVRRARLLSAMLVAAFAASAARAQDVPPPAPMPAEGETAEAGNRGPGTPPAPPAGPRGPAGGPSAPSSPNAEPQGFRSTTEGLLEFHARNLDVAEALAQLRRLTRRNIVVSPEVRAKFTGDLYDVTLAQAIAAICRSGDLVAREEDGFVYVEPAQVKMRMFRLNYVRAKEAVDVLQPLLSEHGKLKATVASGTGIKPDQDAAGGDDYAAAETIVAVDYPGRLDTIEAALRGLDVRPKQILLEATILAANLDDTKSLGVEFKALSGIDFREIGGVSNGGTDLTTGTLPSRQLDELTGSASTGLLQGIPKHGLQFGIIKNEVAAFVRALQEVTDVNVTANPRVMVLNKQRGEVIVGRRDGYLTLTTTQTATEQKVEFLETGTRLLFRPFIGEDGTVRLEIHPEDSNGGVTTSGLPFKETVEVTTNILVHSGQTAVIGGLFRERKVENESKVPVLGDLPLLGGLFRSRTDGVKRQEIIICLTPRIVEPEAAPPRAGDSGSAAAPAPPEGSALVVVDPERDALEGRGDVRSRERDAFALGQADAHRRLADERAAVEAGREDARRILAEAEQVRLAASAEAQKAIAAAQLAEDVRDAKRRDADEAAKAAGEASEEHLRRQAEADDADRAAQAAEAEAAALAEKLAKAEQAAKAAKASKETKAAAAGDAAKRADAAKADEAAKSEDAAKAARAAEDARRAAEQASKSKGAPLPPPIPPAESPPSAKKD